MTIQARPDLPAQRSSGPVVDLGVAEALGQARDHLLRLQHADGWWKGELQTNVTMDAEDLLLRQFLGIRTARDTAASARWIRSQQRADGTWATFHGGPPDLSTTVEAYVALRLAGDDPASLHLSAAATWIRAQGGVERTRVFTRIWLALFGWWDWEKLPVMPPELVLLPSRFPLNVYDWACWARQTVVPLTVVCSLRPRRDLGVDISEIYAGAPEEQVRPRRPLLSWAGAFQRLDRVLHAYERLPVHPLRAMAVRKAIEWIVRRQESDGGWGGIQPPWVYSIIALHLSGYALDHPVLASAIEGLEGFTIREQGPDGPIRRLEACQSPVWDTALAVIALDDAGLAPDHPAQRRAARWLLGEEVRVSGDWAVRRPGLAPGGWAFEFANDGYPDVDDTAEVVLALRRVAGAMPEVEPALRRGVAWAVGMQSRGGGWAAFDADNVQRLCMKLPFCDFGAVIDPPSADVTAHMVEMLAVEARAGHDDPVAAAAARDGIAWLLREQEDDGSWFGRWGANHVYGTGAAVPALVEAGYPATHPSIRRAVRWLAGHQNADGGWGEDLRSYRDPAWRGRGESTASQTAWALLALVAAGEAASPAARRGVEHLVRTQRADGTWDEPWFTGTGFPGDFYINYHLYRLVFPVMALGRYGAALASEAA
ncbi:MAG: squalene--hopene cyclase [Frankiaceae bacterium]